MECIFCRREFKNCKVYSSCLKTEQLSKLKFSSFEHCPVLYTKCDYLLERNVQECTLKLEELLKEYQEIFVQELKTQKELINGMWLHSQRYLILARSEACVKPYPEIISLKAEKRELCQFYTNLENIKRSNCVLDQLMEKIRILFSEFIELSKQLDMNVASPFINGSFSLNSASDIKHILNDLLCCFDGNLCTMISLGNLLHPGDADSNEKYLNFISAL